MNKKFILKYIFLFIVCVILFSGTIKVFHRYRDTLHKDKVVLRFAVTSKSQVFDVTDSNMTAFFEKVYAYSDGQLYNNVDAFIINGNLTGDGSKDAFDAVDEIIENNLRKNTRFFYTTGEDDFSMEDDENVQEYVMANAKDFTVNINGYDLVFWTPVYNSYADRKSVV